jgi:hypothetical protein
MSFDRWVHWNCVCGRRYRAYLPTGQIFENTTGVHCAFCTKCGRALAAEVEPAEPRKVRRVSVVPGGEGMED